MKGFYTHTRFRGFLLAASYVGFAVLVGGEVWGSPDPGTFSLDSSSPSGVLPGDLLNPGGPPPSTQVSGTSLGLVGVDEVDALSAGIDAVQECNMVYFSVDGGSLGLGGGPSFPLDVNGQALRAQHAGDVFITTSLLGVACVPIGINSLRDNQALLGEIPLITPDASHTGPADNLDALTFEELDLTNDLLQDVPVYFSLGSGSPSLGGQSPGDILISPPGGGSFSVFAPAESMGLVPADDLDALVLLDLGTIGSLDPNVDMALFSLAPASPTLVAGGLSPADIFMTTFSGSGSVRYSGGDLGLRPEDNVDAMEVACPEPMTLAFLGLGGLLLILRRRRQFAGRSAA